MAMWKYLKRYDEKIFENIFFEILSLPYFRKFSHLKISTYTVYVCVNVCSAYMWVCYVYHSICAVCTYVLCAHVHVLCVYMCIEHE